MLKKMEKKKIFTTVIVGVCLIVVGYLGYVFFVANRLEFKENEKLFLAGATKYYDFNPTKLPSVNGFREVSLDDMYKGKWVDVLKVNNKMCEGDSFIRVINDNGNYRYITYLKCGRYESKIDKEKPEIILNGDDTVIVHLNSTYQDAGIKEVKDNKDKISPSDVLIDASKVNTSKVGTYEVSYKVQDKTHNIGKSTRKVIVAETLSDNIKRNKGEKFVYTGEADDNYVLFSGMMFRIVSTDGDGNVKLITDNTISNVNYGDNDLGFKDSNIYTWLNEYFYNNLNSESRKYMKEVTWCYDNQENPGIIDTCNNSVNAKVGLLSVSEYERAKVNNRSYLTQIARYAFLNKQSDNDVWITNIYNDNALSTIKTSDLIGVRPVIVLDKSIFLTGGNGSIADPFKLQDYTYAKENDKLNTRLIGEYVRYSGYNFRISDIDDDGNIKLTAVDLLENKNNQTFISASFDSEVIKPNPNEKGNLYYNLNENAINYITDDLIVSHEYKIPMFELGKKYNKFKTTKIKSKISVPASYEMFSAVSRGTNNIVVYWLSDYSEDGVVTIVNGNNGIAFNVSVSDFNKNALKIVIYLSSTTKIASGKGTVSNPYYVR